MKKIIISICVLLTLLFSPVPQSKAFFGEQSIKINIHNKSAHLVVTPKAFMKEHGEVYDSHLTTIKPGESTYFSASDSAFSFIGPEGSYRFHVTDPVNPDFNGYFFISWDHPYGKESTYLAKPTLKADFIVSVDHEHATGVSAEVNVYIMDKKFGSNPDAKEDSNL